MVDHDRLFKQLLSTFFLEFLQLFAPELAEEVEAGPVEFMDKETFTDAIAGDRHIVDLLARVRVRGMPGCVLVHVEPQANDNDIGKFPQRMFRYFAGLEARHPDVPIYPVAVFSFDRTPQPDTYEMALPGLKVLAFRFRVVQLNQLSWRDYLKHHNPVAAALMSCMRIEPKDRWRVKVDSVRLLVRLKLVPGKAGMVARFVDTYLKLDGRERRLYERKVQSLPAKEGSPSCSSSPPGTWKVPPLSCCASFGGNWVPFRSACPTRSRSCRQSASNSSRTIFPTSARRRISSDG